MILNTLLLSYKLCEIIKLQKMNMVLLSSMKYINSHSFDIVHIVKFNSMIVKRLNKNFGLIKAKSITFGCTFKIY